MKCQYIEAPNRAVNLNNLEKTVFLAGSITGANDWQKEAADKLLPHFNVFNPRRANYSTFDLNAEREQITWEHNYLQICQIILFYFSWETLAPITLLEYGAALEDTKTRSYQKIYTAIHPDYKRKNDVIIQTELRNAKWSRNITFDLNQTINQIINENR
jgi:hypothetical protein